MLKGAIFDMDGLMFDTERVYKESWIILADRYGLVHNPDFPTAVAGSSGEKMRRIINHYYPEVDAEEFMNACYQRVSDVTAVEVPEKKGLRQILALFKENGVKMAVASSSRLPNIVRNLRTAGISEYFDAVISSSDPAVKEGKPAPDVFLYAAERIGIAPEECYVFEDSLNGIRAGHAAGATAVMIPDTMQPTDDIRRICRIFPDLMAAADAIEAEKL